MNEDKFQIRLVNLLRHAIALRRLAWMPLIEGRKCLVLPTRSEPFRKEGALQYGRKRK